MTYAPLGSLNFVGGVAIKINTVNCVYLISWLSYLSNLSLNIRLI